MTTLLLIFAVIVLVLLLIGVNKPRKPQFNYTVEHVDRDESYLSYYDERGRLHQETDGCSACIHSRAVQLQEQGVKLIRVELGRAWINSSPSIATLRKINTMILKTAIPLHIVP
jgi:hypothetical protein